MGCSCTSILCRMGMADWPLWQLSLFLSFLDSLQELLQVYIVESSITWNLSGAWMTKELLRYGDNSGGNLRKYSFCYFLIQIYYLKSFGKLCKLKMAFSFFIIGQNIVIVLMQGIHGIHIIFNLIIPSISIFVIFRWLVLDMALITPQLLICLEL